MTTPPLLAGTRLARASKRRRVPTPESSVLRAITDLLDLHRIPWRRLNSGAFALTDPAGKRRFFRASWPGAPDLVVFLPAYGCSFIEAKSARGKLSPDQVEFRELCQRHGVTHIVARSSSDVAPWIRSERKTG